MTRQLRGVAGTGTVSLRATASDLRSETEAGYSEADPVSTESSGR